MLTKIKMRFFHILESIKEDGWAYTWKEMVYLKPREAILMQIDLDQLKPLKKSAQQEQIKLIAINEENFSDLDLDYALRNRYLKTVCNLEDGYKAFAITEGKKVLGDLWCAFLANGGEVHPDVDWLNMEFGAKDVYGYDMYLAPGTRGKGSLAGLLLGGVLHHLKDQGYKKLHAYVMADKIPALWLHRMLGFTELGRIEMSRFLFYKDAKKKKAVEA